MKGGKAGRKRKSAGGGAPRPGNGKIDPNKRAGTRPANVAPKKGARKKSYGGSSSTGDE